MWRVEYWTVCGLLSIQASTLHPLHVLCCGYISTHRHRKHTLRGGPTIFNGHFCLTFNFKDPANAHNLVNDETNMYALGVRIIIIKPVVVLEVGIMV